MTGGLEVKTNVTNSYFTTLETTELSVNEGAWSILSTGNLPTPRIGLRGVSLNNEIFMTGRQGNHAFKIFRWFFGGFKSWTTR